MQMKDILQELVNDDLLNCEKCGITNLYWSFKFDVDRKLGLKRDKLIVDHEKTSKSVSEMKANIAHERSLRIDNSALLAAYTANTLKLKSLIEVDDNSKLASLLKLLINGAEIYSDAIEALLSYFVKTGVNISDLRKEFEIPEEFDDMPEFGTVNGNGVKAST